MTDKTEENWREAFNAMNMTPLGHVSLSYGAEVYVGEASSLASNDEIAGAHFQTVWIAKKPGLPGWFSQRIYFPFGAATKQERLEKAVEAAAKEIGNV